MRILPSRIKVGGHVFRVFIGDLEEPDKHFAETDRLTNTITLAFELSRSQQWSSLIHEVLHIMNAQLDENPTAHMLLDSLSEQFFQVLADNGMLK